MLVRNDSPPRSSGKYSIVTCAKFWAQAVFDGNAASICCPKLKRRMFVHPSCPPVLKTSGWRILVANPVDTFRKDIYDDGSDFQSDNPLHCSCEQYEVRPDKFRLPYNLCREDTVHGLRVSGTETEAQVDVLNVMLLDFDMVIFWRMNEEMQF